MLGFAIITISIKTVMLSKMNISNINTCYDAYVYYKTNYRGQLTAAEMAYIDRLLFKKILPTELAESFEDRWLQLCIQSVIERNFMKDIGILARLNIECCQNLGNFKIRKNF